MFISVSIESKILPHCKGYPVLLDLASKEAVKSNTAGGSLQEFRSFQLPQVLAVEDPKSTDYSLCVGYPHLRGGSPALCSGELHWVQLPQFKS